MINIAILSKHSYGFITAINIIINIIVILILVIEISNEK